MPRDGTSSILSLAHSICRLVGIYGSGNLALRFTPEFAEAVTALVLACQVLDALDPNVGQIDGHAPDVGNEGSWGIGGGGGGPW